MIHRDHDKPFLAGSPLTNQYYGLSQGFSHGRKSQELLIYSTPWSKYMAQSPKSRLIQGLYKPIQGNYAIYFYPCVTGIELVAGCISWQGNRVTVAKPMHLHTQECLVLDSGVNI